MTVPNLHPACAALPSLSKEEFAELVADIKAKGQLIKIIRMPNGDIIDGRTRWEACESLGIEPICEDNPYTGDDPWGYVASLNLHRRHMTTKQKQEFAKHILLANPQRPNRQIAKLVHLSDNTVGRVRRDLERRSQIANVTCVIDEKGRRQPSHHKNPKTSKTSKEPYRNPYYANHGAGLMKALTLTDEEAGRPSAELAGQQHPDYPPGWNYHLVHVEEHGRVQVVPIEEKARQASFMWFNDLAVAIARLAEELRDPKEIDEIGGTRAKKLIGMFDRNLDKAQRNLTDFVERYQKRRG